MERNKEMIDEIDRICEKYPDLKATKEYFEHLEDKEKNGSTINSMQIMYALVRIKEINKNEKIIKRANVKEETKEQRKADMDKMSQQVENSILNDRKRKKLKLADDMEPGTRFSNNKEVIYEQLSKQIKYLQTVMKTAEKERMKEVNKSKESDLESGWVKESRIPASIWLKSCDRYVKGQMRKIQKAKEKENSNDGAAVVILNDAESEKVEKVEENEPAQQVEETEPEKKEEPAKQEETPEVEKKEEPVKQEEEPKVESRQETIKTVRRTIIEDIQEPEPTRETTAANKQETVETLGEPKKEKKDEQVKSEVGENTTAGTMEQLDNWASQIVSKANKGEKIEDILKENITTESIIEKIQKGDININDAKKAINDKCVKETGKIDEKLVAVIAKYLIQRTSIINTQNIGNGDIMIAVSSKDLIRKQTLWERIKSFFKSIGGKIKGIFTKNKTKKEENTVTKPNASTSAKNSKDEFRKNILVDTKNVQIKTSDGKYVATKYTIIDGQAKNPTKTNEGGERAE